MNAEDEKKTIPETVEIKSVPDAEIEFLSERETPGGAPPAQQAAPESGGEAEDHKPGKGKSKKRDAESLKAALREIEGRAADLESQSAASRKEAAEVRDKYLRTLAETENIRKRLDREKSEFYQYALAELLKDILPVIDNFERALKTGEEADTRGFREGVELILKQLLELVRKQGVVPLERSDRAFDPAVHQAVVTEESEDVTEPVVGEELQRGYLIKDRLLRPALVKVLLPKKD